MVRIGETGGGDHSDVRWIEDVNSGTAEDGLETPAGRRRAGRSRSSCHGLIARLGTLALQSLEQGDLHPWRYSGDFEPYASRGMEMEDICRPADAMSRDGTELLGLNSYASAGYSRYQQSTAHNICLEPADASRLSSEMSREEGGRTRQPKLSANRLSHAPKHAN